MQLKVIGEKCYILHILLFVELFLILVELVPIKIEFVCKGDLTKAVFQIYS